MFADSDLTLIGLQFACSQIGEIADEIPVQKIFAIGLGIGDRS
jgi:hypothetical protein